jgi:putative MATE family efflux protein
MAYKAPMSAPAAKKFDRSLIDGPISGAILKIAWPTIIQNLIAGLQGLIDHALVGHYVGYHANAAIGVSWQIFLVIVVFISSIFSGMGVLVARAAGAGDSAAVSRVVFQGVLLALFIGVGIFAPVGWVLAPYLLQLVHAAPDVQAVALPYLRLMFVFSIGMMFFYLIGGALRAAGDAKTPMRLGILLTLSNLVLATAFITGAGPLPAMGVTGAAIGTTLAGAITSIVALWLLFSGRLVIDLRTAARKIDWPAVKAIFRFGLPTGFQGIAMNLGGVFMLRYVGSLDHSAEAQAAYAVSYNQLFSFISWTSVALMAAAATVAGQSLGAGMEDRARMVPREAVKVGLYIATPLALLFLFAPKLLLGIFGMKDPLVLQLGEQFLAYLSLSAFFLMAALAYTGALQGTGDTRSPMYISIFSQLMLPLGICALLDMSHGLRPADIWLAIVIGHFARCALSMLRFHQGKWRHIEVSIGNA